MIGLYKAIRDFNGEMQTRFRSFAELCITRQIITAIKSATRQKHQPLNTYVSFSRPVAGDDGGDRVLGDLLATVAISDPADLVISGERIRALQEHVDTVLSDLEAEVLRLYVDGKSYQEIAVRSAGTPSRSTTRCSGSSASSTATFASARWPTRRSAPA
jgi:RNA polymerase sporulation-specific sigma factor